MFLRELKPHEVQIIMFAKSCLICHQDTYLYTCTICCSVSYYANHAEQLPQQYFENLQLYFLIFTVLYLHGIY